MLVIYLSGKNQLSNLFLTLSALYFGLTVLFSVVNVLCKGHTRLEPKLILRVNVFSEFSKEKYLYGI